MQCNIAILFLSIAKVLQYFLKTEVLNYCNTFFRENYCNTFCRKKINWEWILSPFWKNLLKFLKIFLSISMTAVSISFKMILPIITIFKLLFFIQNNCLKSIEVLQYFNTFLNSKSIAKCNIAILFQPSIAKTIAILFKSIDWRSALLYLLWLILPLISH